MKKTALLLLTGIFMLSLLSCGGSGNKKTEEETSEEKTGKKEETLSLQIGDEEKNYKDISIRFDGMVDQVSVAAFGEESNENIKESIATLQFDGTETGKMKNPSLSIDGYSVEEISGTVASVKTGKHQYTGRTTLESIKGKFQAKVKKKDENGFPQGESIDLKGNFEK